MRHNLEMVLEEVLRKRPNLEMALEEGLQKRHNLDDGEQGVLGEE